jgi:STE24 endopeptidase
MQPRPRQTGFPLLLLFLVMLSAPMAATAQRQPAVASAQQSQSSLAASQPITQYTLPPEKLREAVDLARTGRELYFEDFAASIILLILLLRLRIASRFRDWAEAATSNRLGQAAIFTALLLVTMDLLVLPLDARGHALVLQYRLSVQPWGSWLADFAKNQAFTILIGALLAWLAFIFLQRSPRRWWFWFWCIAVPLVVFATFLEPLVFEPMFYDFRPLAASDPQLTQKIEEISARAGIEIPENRIFEMLASKKLNELNAYVTGIGPSKRVVVWDTLFAKMTDDEVLDVVGHELGHYVLGHVWKGIVLSMIGLFISLWILRWLLELALNRWAGQFGIRQLADWPTLAALWLLASLLTFAATPITNAISRHFEHQADQFGLEVIHGVVPDAPQVAAHSDQVLGEVDLEEPDPSPLAVFWFYDHPPIAQRIQFSLHYDPWASGQKPEFVGR